MIAHVNKWEYDVFKDSPLRYLGYSNEFGEAFRNVVSRRVLIGSYAVEITYFFSDVVHKAYLSFHSSQPNTKKIAGMLADSSHTILWQFLASVTLPAFIINRVVKLSKYIVQKRTTNLNKIRWIPTLIGLSFMPIMPYVVDPVVDDFLEHFFHDSNKLKESINSIENDQTKRL